MDLKQEKEPKSVPYPIAVMTVVAGGFFLLGVGISAYTLNAVEASATSTQQRLNIAKLAESQTRRSGIETDVMIFDAEEIDGTLTVEYPTGWEMEESENGNTFTFTSEEEMLYIGLNDEGENTHIQTATNFAAELYPDLEEEVELTLLDSGQTAGEELVFGVYSFDVEVESEMMEYTIAVVDIQENEDGGKTRMVLATNSTASLLNNLLDTVNISM